MEQQRDIRPAAAGSPANSIQDWKVIVARYQKPALGRGVWQVINTVLPYLALWFLLLVGLMFSAWLVPPLAILAGAFMVRMFIIHHDCGHGSFFASRRANDILGFITGVLTFTPYHHWRWEHSIHHATSGNLDRRGTGDIWTLTVREYLQASRLRRFAYRLVRNPFILFIVGPLFVLLVKHRFPKSGAGRRERLSVHWTNLGILGWAAAFSWMFGWPWYLAIQSMILLVAGSAGFWLFYVQHQFESVYWERKEEWDFATAALQGSSFYKLPKVLQWFSGNIGFHHIHHLSARIPNYNLERCHRAEPLFQTVKPITLLSSLRSLRFRLWDEEQLRLVGFGALRERRASME